jgi:hypothetical protein
MKKLVVLIAVLYGAITLNGTQVMVSQDYIEKNITSKIEQELNLNSILIDMPDTKAFTINW